MKNLIHFLLMILMLYALFLLTACEKELDMQYHDIDARLVIEAVLTDRDVRVSLTNTTPMAEPMDLKRLTDADVRLTDVTTGISRILTPLPDGSYGDDTGGVEGHEYRVDVARLGKAYSSSCSMRAPTHITALDFRWIKMPYDYVAVLQVSFADLPETDDFYWVRILRNGEPYMWSVTDDSHAVDGVINEVVMTSRKDTAEEDEESVLVDGDKVDVLVAPVSRAMRDYLIALSADSNGPRMWTGDLCLGYFLAAPVATGSIEFHPDEMEEYR